MRKLLAASTLSLLSFGLSPAIAGGFYLQEQSPLGLGRAFAGEAAAATDASTVFFNPAGMARLPGNSLTAGVHALFVDSQQTDRGSTRTVPGAGLTIPTGGNNGGNPFNNPVFVPAAYGAFRVNDGPLWLGIGLSTPFGLKVVYDDGWFGRYDSIRSELKTINIQPSVAYALSDRLSIGAGFDIQTIEAELTNALPNPSPLLPDGLLRLKGDDLSFGWNAGVLADLGVARVGAHYRSRIEHNLGGQLTISGLLGPLAAANGARYARAPITTPDIATVSAVVGAGGPLRFLASANWYNWSVFDRIEVRPIGGAATVSEQNYKDTWGLHGAVEYDVSSNLTLRAGTAYDKTPTRDAFRTTRVPDGDRTWATAGATWRWRGLEANLSYAHVFVTKEPIDRTDPLFAGTPAVTSVRTISQNSGNVDAVALSLAARF